MGIMVDGGAKKLVTFDTDELRGPISDRDAMISDIIRLAISGLSRAQARAKMQAGIVVTL